MDNWAGPSRTLPSCMAIIIIASVVDRDPAWYVEVGMYTIALALISFAMRKEERRL